MKPALILAAITVLLLSALLLRSQRQLSAERSRRAAVEAHLAAVCSYLDAAWQSTMVSGPDDIQVWLMTGDWSTPYYVCKDPRPEMRPDFLRRRADLKEEIGRKRQGP
jgi:hypothetical protein